MNQNFIEIKFTYQNQTLTQKVCSNDQCYKKFESLLKTASDELVIIINNDYNNIVPRDSKFNMLKNEKDYNVYNIKDLLKEKIACVNKNEQNQNLYRKEQVQNFNQFGNLQISNTITVSQEIGQDSDYETSILESVQKEIIQSCIQCNRKIIGNTIQTNCYHHYHQECLKESVINQINKNCTKLVCFCNQTLKMKFILYQKSNIEEDQLQKLFDNQLQIIIQKEQIKIIQKCNKKQQQQCKFFYIMSDNQSSYCPLCDDKVSNQTTQI